MSLIVFLADVATVLLAFGKFDFLAWITRGQHARPYLVRGKAGQGQTALVKFFVLVSTLNCNRFCKAVLLGVAAGPPAVESLSIASTGLLMLTTSAESAWRPLAPLLVLRS